MSSLAAYYWLQITDSLAGRAIIMELEPRGSPILALTAPGMINPVSIKKVQLLSPEQEVIFTDHGSVIAVDGEREVEVRKKDV